MPYDVSIDHAARTILVRGTGTGTTAGTLQLIAEQQALFLQHPRYCMLYDSSELEIESSPADMLKVADALFSEAKASFRRFAIVVPPSRAHLARIFTALADPYDIDANVFTDAADARRWLGIDIDNGAQS